jgi:hypothetical protein
VRQRRRVGWGVISTIVGNVTAVHRRQRLRGNWY